MHTHETVSGHTIELPEDAHVDAFLARLAAMVADPTKTENDMIALAYARENPILEPWPLDEARGQVTAAVLANPAYRVITDLLFRKRLAETGTDPAKIGARYTLTVAETAQRLGVHESAVRQSIAAGRLASWVREGRHYLSPQHVEAYQVGPQGPKPPQPRPTAGAPLRVVAGHVKGYSLKIKAPGELADVERVAEHTIAGTVARWARVAVFTGEHDKARLFILEPAPDGEEQEFVHNAFSVRGRFRIADKINNARKAAEAWKAFEAA
jgi:excisionase family DNA binding protein